MGVAVVLGILFFLILLAGIAGCVVTQITASAKKRKASKTRLGIFLGVGLAGFLLFLFIPFSFHTVDAGEVAVVKHMGEARQVRTSGTYFDFWVTEKYQRYDAKVQNLNIVTSAYSSDAQTMDVRMTVQYQIDTTKAIEIANHYGSLDELSNRIESISVERSKSVLSSYSAMTIIETRATVSPKVEESVKASVDENYYVNIVAVVLTNIDFSDAFEKTVEDKMIAEQEKLKAQYEKETAIINAEKELEVAKLQAEARIEAAKADAQAQIEVAKAEAMALQLKSIEIARALGFTIKEEDVVEIVDGKETVTGVKYSIDFDKATDEEKKILLDYLKYAEYMAKWNGELPNVWVTDGNATIILPTP